MLDSSWIMSRRTCWILLVTCWSSSRLLLQAEAFAYAPNFITKIIQEQTGIKPVGLLEVANDDANDEEEDAGTSASSTAVATAVQDVRTRFPPEPNGYLHLGHAKAVSFNFAVARMFGGTCNMRLDDTNPSKEDKEYVNSILEDVRWVQEGLYDNNNNDEPWNDSVRKTSDYFDQIHAAAVALIESGDAYVDSLTAEEMREYRRQLLRRAAEVVRARADESVTHRRQSCRLHLTGRQLLYR